MYNNIKHLRYIYTKSGLMCKKAGMLRHYMHSSPERASVGGAHENCFFVLFFLFFVVVSHIAANDHFTFTPDLTTALTKSSLTSL